MQGCGLRALARLRQRQHREFLVNRCRCRASRSQCQISRCQRLVNRCLRPSTRRCPSHRPWFPSSRLPSSQRPLIGLPIILRLLLYHKKAGSISRYRSGLLTSLSLSLPKNSPLMTTPAPLLHRFHIRTPPNTRNSQALPPHQHRLLLHPNCPITRELLHSRNHLFLHKYKRLNILHPKRPTANILFRLNSSSSNSRVVSALAHSTLKLALRESIMDRRRSSPLNGRDISRSILESSKRCMASNHQ